LASLDTRSRSSSTKINNKNAKDVLFKVVSSASKEEIIKLKDTLTYQAQYPLTEAERVYAESFLKEHFSPEAEAEKEAEKEREGEERHKLSVWKADERLKQKEAQLLKPRDVDVASLHPRPSFNNWKLWGGSGKKRKSKKRKSKNRKSKNRKSKNRKSKNRRKYDC